MNRILSQAIRKAVSEYSPKVEKENQEKRPDLFSLSNETELFQNEKGLTIKKSKIFYKNIFFPKSRLNYAENLLKKRNNEVAINFLSDTLIIVPSAKN